MHFHDLRQAGATWYAPGATLQELQVRLCHASPTAAMRYQHATPERDALLAETMSERMTTGTIIPISASAKDAPG